MPLQAINGILNYLRISGTLGTAGQPDPGQFTAIRAAGYEAVINLAMPDYTNALTDERELVVAQGMSYIHIPVVWEEPTTQDLELFFGAMDELAGRKVFVHCALNYRVTCFVLLYRVIRQGEFLYPDDFILCSRSFVKNQRERPKTTQ